MNANFVIYRETDGEIIQWGLVDEQDLPRLVLGPGERLLVTDEGKPAMSFRVDITADPPVVVPKEGV